MSKLHYKELPTPAQKSSFAQYLSEDEELILITGLGAAYLRSKFIMYMMFPGMVFFGLVFLVGWFLKIEPIYSFGVGLILMILSALSKTMHLHHANRYLLTTRRVIIKQGVFSVKLTAALFDKITH